MANTILSKNAGWSKLQLSLANFT
jgi:ATP-dependent DNA ligase